MQPPPLIKKYKTSNLYQLIICAIVILIAGYLLGRFTSPRYHFDTSNPGLVYRCDEINGQVEVIIVKDGGKVYVRKLEKEN